MIFSYYGYCALGYFFITLVHGLLHMKKYPGITDLRNLLIRDTEQGIEETTEPCPSGGIEEPSEVPPHPLAIPLHPIPMLWTKEGHRENFSDLDQASDT